MADFNPDEYLGTFNPDEYLNYNKLNQEKSKADLLRERLRAEPWLQRNIEGAMTAPSNLLEGIKQGAYELTHAKNPLDVATRGVPQEGYDTSKIIQNRIIASEAPVGALAGNVATYAPLAFAPGANRVVGGLGYGALAGAIQPTTEGESRASNITTGALMGGVVPTVERGIKLTKSLAEPFTQKGQENIIGRTLSTVSGAESPEIINRLKTAQALIAGSEPTAAEVAQSGGISALQRAAMQANPEAYTTRALEQQTARNQALRNIAKDLPAIEKAKMERASATSPLYEQAKSSTISLDKDLKNILDKLPSGVISKAKDLARQDEVPFVMETSSTSAGHPLMPKKVIEGETKISGGALNYIDKALSDIISKTGESSLGKTEKNLATQTRKQLTAYMENKIPEYGQAQKLFAEKSRPINQMQVGQNLIEKISPALSDFGALGKETAAKYAQALRNSLQTVKSATGFEKPIENLMTPQQMETLTNVGRDLARRSNAQELGRGVGSNTFQNLAMENIAQQSGMPGLTGHVVGGVDALLRHAPLGFNLLSPTNLLKRKEQAIQQKLADILLNPQEAARIMELANQPKSYAYKYFSKAGKGGAYATIPELTQGEQ